MEMNKVIVKLYVPSINNNFDIKLPLNKKIYNVIILLLKGINDLNENDEYKPERIPMLYNKETGECYNLNIKVKETNIVNGTELVLI